MNLFKVFFLMALAAKAAAETIASPDKPPSIPDTSKKNLRGAGAGLSAVHMFSAYPRNLHDETISACTFATSNFVSDYEVNMLCTVVRFDPSSISAGEPILVAGNVFKLKSTDEAHRKLKNPKHQGSSKFGSASKKTNDVQDDEAHEYIPLTLDSLNGDQKVSFTVKAGTQVYGCVWGAKDQVENGDGKERSQMVVIIEPCKSDQNHIYDPKCHTYVSFDAAKLSEQMDKKYAAGHNDAVPMETPPSSATAAQSVNTTPKTDKGQSEHGRELDSPGNIEFYVRIAYSALAAEEMGVNNLNGNALNQILVLNNILHYQGFNNIEFKLKDVIVVDGDQVGKSSSELLTFARYSSNIARDGADELIFVVSGREMTSSCGIGFVDCGIQRSAEMTEQCMTAVVNLNCLYRFSLQHEIGHNFGLNHNVESAQSVSPRLQGAFGYYYTKDDGEVQGTIMSYFGDRVPVFSQDGATYNGVPIGSPEANNIRVFMQVAWEVYKNYFALRGRATPPTTEPPTMPTATPTLRPTAQPTIATNSGNSSSAAIAPGVGVVVGAAAVLGGIAAARRKGHNSAKAGVGGELPRKAPSGISAYKSNHKNKNDVLVSHAGQSASAAPVTFSAPHTAPQTQSTAGKPPPPTPRPLKNDSPKNNEGALVPHAAPAPAAPVTFSAPQTAAQTQSAVQKPPPPPRPKNNNDPNPIASRVLDGIKTISIEELDELKKLNARGLVTENKKKFDNKNKFDNR